MKRFLAIMLSLILMLSLVACKKNEDPQEPQVDTEKTEGALYRAGTYTKEAEGYNKGKPIKVEVVLSDNAIEAVNVLEHEETEGIGATAIENLPKAILEKQSADVEIIASATVTSEALLKAVKEILEENTIGDPSAKGKKEEVTTGEEVLETDVLVIGAGGAGLAAAIEANDQGKSVILVEKAQLTGGNTTRATGGMNAAKTKYQDENELTEAEVGAIKARIETARKDYPELKELADTVEKQFEEYQANPQGYFDSKELFILDSMVGGHGLNDIELFERLAEESSKTIDWLQTMGMEVTTVGSLGGASVKRAHKPMEDGKTLAIGPYLVPRLTSVAEDKNIDIIFGKGINELIVEDGKVVGAKADGLEIRSKSTVLATGGFAANLDMVVQYNPDLKGFVSTNAPTVTGDGIVMAEKIGAQIIDMEYIQIHPTVEQETASLITEGVRGDGAILVNQEGQRFTDETGTRDKVSAAEIAQTGGYAYLIVDQKMMDKSNPLQGYKSKGFTKEGETVEELAGQIDVDPATLKETLDKWNQAVESKNDPDFNRTSFTEKLDQGPFYAIKVSPGIHHTMGGVKINTEAEVLDKEGNPIPNLYAAGEVTGGVHGGNRLGGNAVSDILIYGRIAGGNAAKNAK